MLIKNYRRENVGKLLGVLYDALKGDTDKIPIAIEYLDELIQEAQQQSTILKNYLIEKRDALLLSSRSIEEIMMEIDELTKNV